MEEFKNLSLERKLFFKLHIEFLYLLTNIFNYLNKKKNKPKRQSHQQCSRRGWLRGPLVWRPAVGGCQPVPDLPIRAGRCVEKVSAPCSPVAEGATHFQQDGHKPSP